MNTESGLVIYDCQSHSTRSEDFFYGNEYQQGVDAFVHAHECAECCHLLCLST